MSFSSATMQCTVCGQNKTVQAENFIRCVQCEDLLCSECDVKRHETPEMNMHSRFLPICCSNCDITEATTRCKDCADVYCANCDLEMHIPKKFESHVREKMATWNEYQEAGALAIAAVPLVLHEKKQDPVDDGEASGISDLDLDSLSDLDDEDLLGELDEEAPTESAVVAQSSPQSVSLPPETPNQDTDAVIIAKQKNELMQIEESTQVEEPIQAEESLPAVTNELETPKSEEAADVTPEVKAKEEALAQTMNNIDALEASLVAMKSKPTEVPEAEVDHGVSECQICTAAQSVVYCEDCSLYLCNENNCNNELHPPMTEMANHQRESVTWPASMNDSETKKEAKIEDKLHVTSPSPKSGPRADEKDLPVAEEGVPAMAREPTRKDGPDLSELSTCKLCMDVQAVLYCHDCALPLCRENECDEDMHRAGDGLEMHMREPMDSYIASLSAAAPLLRSDSLPPVIVIEDAQREASMTPTTHKKHMGRLHLSEIQTRRASLKLDPKNIKNCELCDNAVATHHCAECEMYLCKKNDCVQESHSTSNLRMHDITSLYGITPAKKPSTLDLLRAKTNTPTPALEPQKIDFSSKMKNASPPPATKTPSPQPVAAPIADQVEEKSRETQASSEPVTNEVPEKRKTPPSLTDAASEKKDLTGWRYIKAAVAPTPVDTDDDANETRDGEEMCESCEDNIAAVNCKECDMLFCAECNRDNHQTRKTKTHHRNPVNTAFVPTPTDALPVNALQITALNVPTSHIKKNCDVCESSIATLFCPECDMSLCTKNGCDSDMHQGALHVHKRTRILAITPKAASAASTPKMGQSRRRGGVFSNQTNGLPMKKALLPIAEDKNNDRLAAASRHARSASLASLDATPRPELLATLMTRIEELESFKQKTLVEEKTEPKKDSVTSDKFMEVNLELERVKGEKALLSRELDLVTKEAALVAQVEAMKRDMEELKRAQAKTQVLAETKRIVATPQKSQKRNRFANMVRNSIMKPAKAAAAASATPLQDEVKSAPTSTPLRLHSPPRRPKTSAPSLMASRMKDAPDAELAVKEEEVRALAKEKKKLSKTNSKLEKKMAKLHKKMKKLKSQHLKDEAKNASLALQLHNKRVGRDTSAHGKKLEQTPKIMKRHKAVTTGKPRRATVGAREKSYQASIRRTGSAAQLTKPSSKKRTPVQRLRPSSSSTALVAPRKGLKKLLKSRSQASVTGAGKVRRAKGKSMMHDSLYERAAEQKRMFAQWQAAPAFVPAVHSTAYALGGLLDEATMLKLAQRRADLDKVEIKKQAWQQTRSASRVSKHTGVDSIPYQRISLFSPTDSVGPSKFFAATGGGLDPTVTTRGQAMHSREDLFAKTYAFVPPVLNEETKS